MAFKIRRKNPRGLFLPFSALLSVLVFAYNLYKTEWIDLRIWNHVACNLSQTKEFIHSDCLFSLRKAQVMTQPLLKRGEELGCRAPKSNELDTFKEAEAKVLSQEPLLCESSVWSQPYKIPEIGWDAYTPWYARSLVLWLQHRLNDFQWNFSTDSIFAASFPKSDTSYYPWAQSFIGFLVLKAAGNPHPFILECVQILFWILSCFLFYKLWPLAPKALWICFALTPISSKFLFNIYADPLLIFSLLSVFYLLESKHFIGAGLVAALIPQIKSEGWLHLLCVILFYFLSTFSKRAVAESFTKTSKKLIYIFVFGLGSTLYYLNWSKAFDYPKDYVSLVERLIDFRTYTERLPLIFGYYLDVLFRVGYWGLLWPLIFYILVKQSRRQNFYLPILPLMMLLIAIPVAFIKFPDGSFREVVLTGSNRALWQCLPLSWMLLKYYSLGDEAYKES